MREQPEVTLLDTQISSSELELLQLEFKGQEGALAALQPEEPQQLELQERKSSRSHPGKNQGVYLSGCTRVMAVIFRVAVLFFVLVSLLYSKTEKSDIAFGVIFACLLGIIASQWLIFFPWQVEDSIGKNRYSSFSAEPVSLDTLSQEQNRNWELEIPPTDTSNGSLLQFVTSRGEVFTYSFAKISHPVCSH